MATSVIVKQEYDYKRFYLKIGLNTLIFAYYISFKKTLVIAKILI